jgi:hypothetical protein
MLVPVRAFKGWHGETASPPGGGRRIVRRGEHRVLRLPHGRESLIIQVCLRPNVPTWQRTRYRSHQFH